MIYIYIIYMIYIYIYIIYIIYVPFPFPIMFPSMPMARFFPRKRSPFAAPLERLNVELHRLFCQSPVPPRSPNKNPFEPSSLAGWWGKRRDPDLISGISWWFNAKRVHRILDGTWRFFTINVWGVWWDFLWHIITSWDLNEAKNGMQPKYFWYTSPRNSFLRPGQ